MPSEGSSYPFFQSFLDISSPHNTDIKRKNLALAKTRGKGACDCEALSVAMTKYSAARDIDSLGERWGGINYFTK
jgi:hypothetical protein